MKQRMALCVLCCFAGVTSVPTVYASALRSPPRNLTRAIGCLVAAPYIQKYALAPIGLKAGDWTSARFSIGSIPGLMPTPGLYNVLIYSKDSRRAALLLADPNGKGGFLAIRNGWLLTKHDAGWSAEGEGGYADYEAVATYAKAMETNPEYQVRLTPGGRTCTQMTVSGDVVE